LKTNLGNNASGYNASLIVSTSAGSGTQLAKSFSLRAPSAAQATPVVAWLKPQKAVRLVTLNGGTNLANGSCKMIVKVTAPCNNYFNNLAAGSLKTSNGNNQQPAGASLTVTAH
jgi:hypothetical protein